MRPWVTFDILGPVSRGRGPGAPPWVEIAIFWGWHRLPDMWLSTQFFLARAPPLFACDDSAAQRRAALRSWVHACAALRPCIAGAGKLVGVLVSSVAGACSLVLRWPRLSLPLPWRVSRILCDRATPGCCGCVRVSLRPALLCIMKTWMGFCTGDCQSLAGLRHSHCYAQCTVCEQGNCAFGT